MSLLKARYTYQFCSKIQRHSLLKYFNVRFLKCKLKITLIGVLRIQLKNYVHHFKLILFSCMTHKTAH